MAVAELTREAVIRGLCRGFAVRVAQARGRVVEQGVDLHLMLGFDPVPIRVFFVERLPRLLEIGEPRRGIKCCGGSW